MYVNTTKQKLKAGQPAFGFASGLASPIAVEMLASCGIDFVFLDNQHGSFGADSTIACLMAVSTGPATPVARVARNDYTMVGRLIDEGCMGVVFPMVHTAEDARQARANAKTKPTARSSSA